MNTPAPSEVLGRWRITEITGWDDDYIDMLGPGHIQLDRDGGVMALAFGVVQIGLECWYSQTGVHFTFHGSDEDTEVFGDGDADLEPDGTPTGAINVHNGDDMPSSPSVGEFPQPARPGRTTSGSAGRRSRRQRRWRSW